MATTKTPYELKNDEVVAALRLMSEAVGNRDRPLVEFLDAKVQTLIAELRSLSVTTPGNGRGRVIDLVLLDPPPRPCLL